MARRASRTSTETTTGFTIVELLIVVVVIAILAAITIMSYNGIANRAKVSSVQASTKQAYTKIKAFAVDNTDTFPANLAAVGVNNSGSISYQYYVNNGVVPSRFCISSTEGTTAYFMSSAQTSPQQGNCNAQNIANTSLSNWESGQYSQTTGLTTNDPARLRQLDFIAVEPGATYTFTTNQPDYNFAVRAYDGTRTFLSSLGGVAPGGTFTMPAGASYISLSMYGPSSATYMTYVNGFNNGNIIPGVVRSS